MRPPPTAEIAAPDFPPEMDWIGSAPQRIDRLLGDGCVLIEFFDTARINSHRTLPYVKAWHRRYADLGLTVIGIHSPGYSFGRDRELARRALEALGVRHPVLLDPNLIVWRLYDNRGWPARYLFDRRGMLRYVHYGEGGYAETERAIVEVLGELDRTADLPEPLAPLRPEDADGVLLEPQTPEVILPTQRARLELVRDWTAEQDYIEAADSGAAATVEWTGEAAYAVLSGAVAPGLYLTDGTVVADDPGLRLHGFQFLPRGVAVDPLPGR